MRLFLYFSQIRAGAYVFMAQVSRFLAGRAELHAAHPEDVRRIRQPRNLRRVEQIGANDFDSTPLQFGRRRRIGEASDADDARWCAELHSRPAGHPASVGPILPATPSTIMSPSSF